MKKIYNHKKNLKFRYANKKKFLKQNLNSIDKIFYRF